jgi:hypothetical protein
VYKTIPHTLEELRNNICSEISAISRDELRELAMYSAGTLSAFSQKGNIFSTHCSTGESLLCFLKVILSVIACC